MLYSRLDGLATLLVCPQLPFHPVLLLLLYSSMILNFVSRSVALRMANHSFHSVTIHAGAWGKEIYNTPVT